MKNKNIKLKTALIVIIAGVVGAILGAKISVNLNVTELRKYFGYFLIIIAILESYTYFKEYIKNKETMFIVFYSKSKHGCFSIFDLSI